MAQHPDLRPKLDDSLGNWSKVQIINLIRSNDAQLLHQSLLAATAKFFQPSNLKEMAQTTILSKDKHNNAKKKIRIKIHLGRTDQHEKNFSRIHQATQYTHKTFTDQMVDFYDSLFNSKEKDSIRKVMENKESFHLVIYDRLKLKGVTRGAKCKDHDVVIAAASFMFADQAVLLNWMGVSKIPFEKKETSVHENSLRPSETKNYQKHYHLGTFLLCAVQKILWFFQGTFNVVAQVNHLKDQGAIMFYRKNFFVAAWRDDPTGKIVANLRNKHKEHLLKDKNLTYMICTVPIFLVRPWWFKGVTNIYVMQYVLEVGLQYILQLPKRTEDNQDAFNDLLQQSVKVKELLPVIPATFQKHIRDDYELTEEEKTIYGDDKEVIEMLADSEGYSPIETRDHGQGKEKDGKSCAYVVMSLGLFGTPKFYKEMRLFFYMLFQAFSVVHDDCDLVLPRNIYEDDESSFSAFQRTLNLLINEINDFDGQEEARYRLTYKVKNFPTNSDQIRLSAAELKAILKVYSFAQLHYDFMGGEIEFQLFSQIFNINICVFSSHSTLPRQQDGLRLWNMSVQKVERPFKFIDIAITQVPYLKNRSEQYLFIAKVANNEHFVEVRANPNAKSVVDLIDSNNGSHNDSDERAAIIEKIKNWIKNRTDKKKARLYEEDFFSPEEFFHPFLSTDRAMLSCMLLDPLAKWDDLNNEWITGFSLHLKEVLHLHPTAWITDGIINSFVEILNKTKKDKKMAFVHPMTVEQYWHHSNSREAIKNRLKDYDIVLVASFVDMVHFVFLEFDTSKYDPQQTLHLTIRAADSMNSEPDNDPSSFISSNVKSLFLIYDIFAKGLLRINRNSRGEITDDREEYIPLKFKICRSIDFEMQLDGYNCGIYVLRRMYVYSKLSVEEIRKTKNDGILKQEFDKLPDAKIFRIFVLQSILKHCKTLHPDIKYHNNETCSNPFQSVSSIEAPKDQHQNQISVADSAEVQILENPNESSKKKKHIPKRDDNSMPIQQSDYGKTDSILATKTTQPLISITENKENKYESPEVPSLVTENVSEKPHPTLPSEQIIKNTNQSIKYNDDALQFDIDEKSLQDESPDSKAALKSSVPQKTSTSNVGIDDHCKFEIDEEPLHEDAEERLEADDEDTLETGPDEYYNPKQQMISNDDFDSTDSEADTGNVGQKSISKLISKSTAGPKSVISADKKVIENQNAPKGRKEPNTWLKKLNSSNKTNKLKGPSAPRKQFNKLPTSRGRSQMTIAQNVMSKKQSDRSRARRPTKSKNGGKTEEQIAAVQKKRKEDANTKRQEEIKKARQSLVNWDRKIASGPKKFSKFIKKVPEELLKLLENNHKAALPEDQKANWKEHAFDVSQQSQKEAKKAINALLSKRLKEKKEEFNKVVEECETMAKKALSDDEPAFKKKRKQYIALNAEISMLEWEINEVPIFHPRDNIYAMQIAEKEKGIQYYNIVAQEDNGNIVCKRLTEKMVKERMQEQFFTWMEQQEKQKGWVCLTKEGPKIFDPKDPTLLTADKFEPLYTFKDPNMDQTLHFIKCTISWDHDLHLRSKGKKLELSNVVWSVRCENENTYIKVEEYFLKDIITDSEVHRLLNAAVALSREEIKKVGIFKDKNGVQRLIDDENDSTCKGRQRIGNILYPQEIYFNMFLENPNKKYTFNRTTTQVSKLRYDVHKNIFYGIEKTNEKNNRAEKVVPLPIEWVEHQWKNQQMALQNIKKKAEEGMKHFIEVPVADAIVITPTMDINMNPVIKYPQGEEPTCVFSSFASALFYLDYPDEAEAIHDFGKQFLSNPDSRFDRIMNSLIQHVINDAAFAHFRRKYSPIQKVSCTYDILMDSTKHPTYIKLVVLKQSDNHQSHAITVVDSFIFDSNATNTLPLSLEGLNVCCGDADFVSIVHGYVLECKTNLDESILKKRRKKRQKIKEKQEKKRKTEQCMVVSQ